MRTVFYYFVKSILKSIELSLRAFSKKVSIHSLESLCPSVVENSFPIRSAPSGNEPLHIGIIVPFRDNFSMTERCLHYISKLYLPNHVKATLILADNGSSEQSTLDGVDAILASEFPMPILRFIFDYPFNFSKINNDALQSASNELRKKDIAPLTHVWFLNNDVLAIDANSLVKLIATSKIENCGAVGNTLLYPNHKIQHLYAEPFTKIIGSHPFRGEVLPDECNWSHSFRIVPAVTGASLFMKVNTFQTAGKFDEMLPTLGQDIDLCLMLREQKKLIIAATNLILIHEESSTKKAIFPVEEVEYFYKKWSRFSKANQRPILKWSEKLYLSPITWNYPALLYVRSKI